MEDEYQSYTAVIDNDMFFTIRQKNISNAISEIGKQLKMQADAFLKGGEKELELYKGTMDTMEETPVCKRTLLCYPKVPLCTSKKGHLWSIINLSKKCQRCGLEKHIEKSTVTYVLYKLGSNIKIRRAKVSDAESYSILENACHGINNNTASAAVIIRHGKVNLAIDDLGTREILIGACSLIKSWNGRVYIDDLFVDEKYRECGIAKSLLREAIKNVDCQIVGAATHEAVEKINESLGFKRGRNIKNYFRVKNYPVVEYIYDPPGHKFKYN